jgi:hypothetical protein
VCLIDVSGSTNNSGGRGRGRVDVLKSEDQISKSDEQPQKTKIIILAELEGLSKMFAMYAEKYDLTNVKIKIISFGTTVVDNVTYRVSNNELLFDEFLSNLDKKVAYDGGSTNLMEALNYVQNLQLGPSVLVITTDGQPNTNGNASEICQYMEPYLAGESPFEHVITIGAGSIQENQRCLNGSRYNVFFRETTTNEIREATSLSRISSSGAECNNLFLIALASYAKSGVYCPACRNYDELETAFELYLNGIEKRYQVPLDNGTFAEFSSDVNNMLKNCNAVATVTPYGSYLVTRNRQIAIEDLPLPLNSVVEAIVPSELSGPYYDLYVKQFQIIPTIKIKGTTSEYEIQIKLNYDMQPRMRPVVYM